MQIDMDARTAHSGYFWPEKGVRNSPPFTGANHITILCKLLVVSEQIPPIRQSSAIASSTVCFGDLQPPLSAMPSKKGPCY